MQLDSQFVVEFDASLTDLLFIRGKSQPLTDEMICSLSLTMQQLYDIPGIIPLTLEKDHDGLQFCFRFRAYRKLTQWLQMNSLNQETLFQMMKSIEQLLDVCGNYFLKCERLLIHPDYMFIHPRSLQIAVLHIPLRFDRESRLQQTFHAFFDRLRPFARQQCLAILDEWSALLSHPHFQFGMLIEHTMQFDQMVEIDDSLETVTDVQSHKTTLRSMFDKVTKRFRRPISQTEDIHRTVLIRFDEPKLEHKSAFLLDSSNHQEITLSSFPFRIGRDVNLAHYPLTVPTVSRSHVEIDFQSGEYFVKDLGSRNGTKLNGIPISSHQFQRLSDGDHIEILQSSFQFFVGEHSNQKDVIHYY
jgi:hypothetical protein